MSHAYADLANALNALPNGFPRTETGSDLRLLEFMYGEKEAELASRLTYEWESVDIIAGARGIMGPRPAVHRAVPIPEAAEFILSIRTRNLSDSDGFRKDD